MQLRGNQIIGQGPRTWREGTFFLKKMNKYKNSKTKKWSHIVSVENWDNQLLASRTSGAKTLLILLKFYWPAGPVTLSVHWPGRMICNFNHFSNSLAHLFI